MKRLGRRVAAVAERSGGAVLLETFHAWREDGGSQMGAALAFYALFSLVPLLSVVISVTGLAFGREAAAGRVVEEVASLIGEQPARAVQGLIEQARRPGTGPAAFVIGLGALFVGASALVVALQDSINEVWKAEPRPGFLHLCRKHALAYLLVAGLGAMAVVSTIGSAGLALAARRYGSVQLMPSIAVLWNFLLTLAGLIVLLSAIFKWVPDVHVPWRDVWMGAFFTALLFMAGRSFLGFVSGIQAVRSSYGAAGSLVVLLFWIYYSAQIFYLGAEFTKVHARRREK
jgi:membrane protein